MAILSAHDAALAVAEAITGAVASSTAAVKVLSELHNCPHEVLALVNELSDLQYALLEVPPLTPLFTNCDEYSAELRDLLLPAGSRIIQTMQSLNKMVERLKSSTFQRSGRWKKEQANIDLLRDRVRESQLVIMLVLKAAGPR